MENGPRVDIKTIIVDPETFLREISDDKVRLLYMEILMLQEEYERENVIMYLASNYSHNKHLSFTALRSMHDDEIKTILDATAVKMKEEMNRRKKA